MIGKPLNNNVKCENELGQIEALQVDHPIVRPLKKKWPTKPLRKNDDWSTKKIDGHKKNEQRQKVGTTTPHYLKLLEDGIMQDGVESVCNVNLKHHPIKMDI